MYALPKWLTDLNTLLPTADGKTLGRYEGAWTFTTPVEIKAANRGIMKFNANLNKSQVKDLVLPIKANTLKRALNPKANKRWTVS